MRTEEQFSFEILNNGTIQVIKDLVYFKADGMELTRERHRTTLAPTDLERIENEYNKYHLGIFKAVWSGEVVAKYIEEQKEGGIYE